MENGFNIDTNDLRQGRMLIKVLSKDDEKEKVVVFVYSDGNEGRLIIPPDMEVEAEFLKEILRVLITAYPTIKWKVKSEEHEE